MRVSLNSVAFRLSTRVTAADLSAVPGLVLGAEDSARSFGNSVACRFDRPKASFKVFPNGSVVATSRNLRATDAAVRDLVRGLSEVMHKRVHTLKKATKECLAVGTVDRGAGPHGGRSGGRRGGAGASAGSRQKKRKDALDAAGLADDGDGSGRVVEKATGRLAARVFRDVAVVYAASESELRSRGEVLAQV